MALTALTDPVRVCPVPSRTIVLRAGARHERDDRDGAREVRPRAALCARVASAREGYHSGRDTMPCGSDCSVNANRRFSLDRLVESLET